MAFRGRGRGRGRGGFGGGFGFGGAIGNPEPFTLFPEDITLPEISNVTEEKTLVYWNLRLLTYWKSSPYYLEGPVANKSQDIDIERYSDRNKPKCRAKRDPLSYHLKLAPAYFPLELIEGSKRVQHDQRKVRWNPESGEDKIEFLEKLEQQHEARGGKDVKDEKKEAENEEEDEEGVEEEDEDLSDDGDYNQNIDFDDDEDDFNMEDDGNDEPIFGGDDDY